MKEYKYGSHDVGKAHPDWRRWKTITKVKQDIGHHLSLILSLSGITCEKTPTFWVRTPRSSKEFVQIEDVEILSLIVTRYASVTHGVIDCKVEIERLELVSDEGKWGAERVIVVAQISETGKIRVLYRQGFDSPEADVKDLEDPEIYQELVERITERVVQALEALVSLLNDGKEVRNYRPENAMR